MAKVFVGPNLVSLISFLDLSMRLCSRRITLMSWMASLFVHKRNSAIL